MAPRTKTETETTRPATAKKSESKKAEVKSESKKTTKKSESKKEEPKKTTKKSESKKEETKRPASAGSKKSESTKKEKAPKVEKVAKEPAAKEPAAKEPAEKKERRQVTKESLHGDFENFIKSINDEMDRIRNTKPKAKGIKFLKSLCKVAKQLNHDADRVTKFKKNPTVRKTNTNSGFLKPVNISKELASFTGWDINKTYSRTEVTKFICNYVKSNKLFDQSEGADKRNILVDAKLKALLKYDPANPPKDKDGKSLPLTYFRLQQYLKDHFSKPTTEETEVEVEDDTEEEELDE